MGASTSWPKQLARGPSHGLRESPAALHSPRDTPSQESSNAPLPQSQLVQSRGDRRTRTAGPAGKAPPTAGRAESLPLCRTERTRGLGPRYFKENWFRGTQHVNRHLGIEKQKETERSECTGVLWECQCARWGAGWLPAGMHASLPMTHPSELSGNVLTELSYMKRITAGLDRAHVYDETNPRIQASTHSSGLEPS